MITAVRRSRFLAETFQHTTPKQDGKHSFECIFDFEASLFARNSMHRHWIWKQFFQSLECWPGASELWHLCLSERAKPQCLHQVKPLHTKMERLCGQPSNHQEKWFHSKHDQCKINNSMKPICFNYLRTSLHCTNVAVGSRLAERANSSKHWTSQRLKYTSKSSQS